MVKMVKELWSIGTGIKFYGRKHGGGLRGKQGSWNGGGHFGD